MSQMNRPDMERIIDIEADYLHHANTGFIKFPKIVDAAEDEALDVQFGQTNMGWVSDNVSHDRDPVAEAADLGIDLEKYHQG